MKIGRVESVLIRFGIDVIRYRQTAILYIRNSFNGSLVGYRTFEDMYDSGVIDSDQLCILKLRYGSIASCGEIDIEI
jgi:hypothetical protein